MTLIDNSIEILFHNTYNKYYYTFNSDFCLYYFNDGRRLFELLECLIDPDR